MQILLLAVLGCQNSPSTAASPTTATVADRVDSGSDPEPAVLVRWRPPSSPADVGGANRPRIALLTAPWCQWCMVMHDEVLPDPAVQHAIARAFAFAEVDVDRNPEWMSSPGVEGLPAILFFDQQGQHVLSKSGFRATPDLIDLLSAVQKGLEAGELEPYRRRPIAKLATKSIDPERAAEVLSEFERRLFFKVNSNDGGFGSPSRHPRPKLLLELQGWLDRGGAPPRIEEWISRTVESASRGGSPMQRGEPLPDMDFSSSELRDLSARGSNAGPRWREGIEDLPTRDPYLGIRDPVDSGYFRYAAGPGWYNPHFERLASENLAWVLLLRRRGDDGERTLAWARSTFARPDGWMNRAQASDPFYFRLPATDRTAPGPPVADNADLETQAFAARADAGLCDRFASAVGSKWPPARFADPSAPPATPDAVGEALVALASCGKDLEGRAVADAAVTAWSKGLPEDARLHRLAAGVCAVHHPACGRVLATIQTLPVDPEWAPPLVALAEVSGG